MALTVKPTDGVTDSQYSSGSSTAMPYNERAIKQAEAATQRKSAATAGTATDSSVTQAAAPTTETSDQFDWSTLDIPTSTSTGSGKKTDYNALFDNFYNEILGQLQGSGAFTGVDFNNVDYTARTQAQIASEIAEYLKPELESAISSQRASEKANRTAVDVDAASRGMGSSTWVTDSKNRISNATQATIAGLQSDYSSTLAQNVASQYADDIAKQISNDQFNSSKQLEADEYNAELQKALLDAANSLAGAKLDRYKASQKSGGGKRYTINDYETLGALVDSMTGGGASQATVAAVTQGLINSPGLVNPQAARDYVAIASNTPTK